MILRGFCFGNAFSNIECCKVINKDAQLSDDSRELLSSHNGDELGESSDSLIEELLPSEQASEDSQASMFGIKLASSGKLGAETEKIVTPPGLDYYGGFDYDLDV